MMTRLSTWVALLVILSACGTPPTPTAPLSPTPRPTVSEATVSKATPAAAPLPPPTEAPTSTAAATAAPTRPLSATGPWLAIKADDGLWIADADGAGLTHFVDTPLINQIAPSPGGGRIAFITSNAQQYNGLELNLLTLPGGEAKMITPLQQEGVDTLTHDIGSPEYESARAIVEHKALAWSPDGKVLAFIGAPESPSADLYMYFVEDGRIARISEEPSQVYGLSWSADNNRLVFGGVDTFGTGAGYAMAGLWVAHADGAGVGPLYAPTGADETILGWRTPDTFVAVGWNAECGSHSIHSDNINVQNGAPQTLHDNCFNAIAFDPVSGAIMFGVDRFLADFSEVKQKPGVYLLPPDATEAKQVLEVVNATQIEWSLENNAFVVATEESVLAFTPAGEAVDPLTLSQMQGLSQGTLIGVPKAWSPDGQWEAVVSQGKLYVANRSDMAAQLVTDQLSIESITWVGP